MAQPADPPPAARDEDQPHRWLAKSALLDLEDPKLRVRVHSLVQLCQSEREKATTLYHFVKRMPIERRFKLRPHTARAVLDAGCGDASDKATLLVAMLRIAGVPARLRFMRVRGDVLRGLGAGVRELHRPVMEVRLGGAWQQTDTYIYDAATMAAARQRLRDRGWEWGFGIHVDGRMLWDGSDSAWSGEPPEPGHAMLAPVEGVFHDPRQYYTSRCFRSGCRPLLYLLRWNLLVPAMNRAWRALRQEASQPPVPQRRVS